MNNKAFKGGNILWMIITIISLLCAGGLLFLMFQEKNRRMETEQKLLVTEKAKRAVEKELDLAQSEITRLKEEAKLLSEEVAQEKKNYQAALAEVAKRDEKISELEKSLANEKKQRTSLANELAQIKESHDNLEEKLKEAELKLEKLNNQLAKLKAQGNVQLKKIVVKPQEKLRGRVLVVNREFHFVVIDLGRKDGISVGDELTVYLGAEEIGRIQVEKIYDTMSTAAILAGSQEEKIAEDCVVKSF